ncbi:hypothetical protein G7021_22620 [Pseudomonas carnis]|nr:hypothetical protein [Pseudomonas carnis]
MSMSKVIQTVEELDAVLHWRGKHAKAIKELDALQQLLNQRDEQVETLKLQRQGEAAACAHEWTDDGEFTLTCTKCGKTENHEPYGWVQTRGNAINHFTQEWDVVESWEDQGFEYKAMFDHAEQPAPVAVVPERKTWDGLRATACNLKAEAWNACLDELKRLNPSL